MAKTTAAPVESTSTTPAARLRLGAAALAALAIVATCVGIVIAGGSYTPADPGLPDPGPIVGWGLPISRVLTDLAGVLTVAWLLAAAFLDPAGRDGVVSPLGRRDLIRAVGTAGAWAVLALLQMALTLASILGIDLLSALNPEVVATYAWEVANTRALALVALVAVAIVVGALLTSSTGMAAVWTVIAIGGAALPTLAGHGSGFGDHELALTAGVAHAAAAIVWLAGLAVLLVHGLRRERGFDTDDALQRAARRFGIVALVCVVLLGASGAANSYTRLDTVGQLLTTGYGQAISVKIVLLGALVAIAFVVRRRLVPKLRSRGARGTFLKLLALETGLIAAAFGLGVALALSPYPRVESLLPTYGESLLGAPYPPPPSALGILLGFDLEPFFLVASLVAAALYVVGVIRLAQRGDRWPIGRTVAWLAGIGITIWATNAGVSVYGQVSVGLHMVQHMTMAMLAPMLLVLGAPFTLALRALPAQSGPQRNLRGWIVWGLHSTAARVVTNPIFVIVVFSASLFGLYFTPAMGWLMGSHIGHVAMQVHFLLSGYLFAWIVMGLDPVPKPLPYWGKFGMILLALGVHGFFAVVVMMGSEPLAQEWYGIVRPDWVVDPVADTVFGGQVAWGVSEIPMLFMVVMVAMQWARSDSRESRRKDRQADRDGDSELEAYNAYLARLDRGSSPDPSR